MLAVCQAFERALLTHVASVEDDRAIGDRAYSDPFEYVSGATPSAVRMHLTVSAG